MCLLHDNSHLKLLLFLFCITLISCKKEANKDDGYTNKMSYLPGEICEVYINSQKKEQVKIYDVAGTVVLELKEIIFSQEIKNDSAWKYGVGYQKSFEFKVPELKSGVYFIENEIPFFVRSKKPKDITIVYPSNTINAYSNIGGKSLYGFNSSNKEMANTVSFDRPFRFGDAYLSIEFYKYIFDQKYNVNYIIDKDLDDYTKFQKSKLLLIVGHSEYWSRKAKRNFDKFINSGKDALILSGNTMWWQIRYNSNNQMICYRKKHKDPIQIDSLKTIPWKSTILNSSTIESIGMDFDNGGYGNKRDLGWNGYKILNNSPIFEGTSIKKDSTLYLTTTEYDGIPIKCYSKNLEPIVDTSNVPFKKFEIIGYDFGFRGTNTCGTFAILKKNDSSGTIINVGSTDWCSKQFHEGKDHLKIQRITSNMIELLIKKKNVFSND